MEAIKEMDDVRNFVDYSKKEQKKKTIQKQIHKKTMSNINKNFIKYQTPSNKK